MADVLVVTNTVDMEFVDEHEEALVQLEQLAANKRSYEARRDGAMASIATIDAALASAGTRIRRGLVRYKPGLNASLPTPIVDANIDRDTPAQITLRWNAAAVAHRAS